MSVHDAEATSSTAAATSQPTDAAHPSSILCNFRGTNLAGEIQVYLANLSEKNSDFGRIPSNDRAE